MRLAMVLCAFLLAGCGKKADKPAAGGSGSVARQGAPVAGSAGSAQVADSTAGAGSGLAFDALQIDPDTPDALPIVFAGKQPRLPAVSADGTVYADLEMTISGMPQMPVPYDLVLRKVNSDTVIETLTLFDGTESDTASQAGSAWETPALKQKLQARGAAALKKLAGFHSLTMAQVDWSDPKPLKVGSAMLVPIEDDQIATIELQDAKGAVLHRAAISSYSSGTDDTNLCGYTPHLMSAGTDGAMVYADVGYHYRDDCDQPKQNIFGWSTDPAKASPDDAAAGLIAHQLDHPIGAIAIGDAASKAKNVLLDDVQIVASGDGKSGWASGVDSDVRASDVLVKTPAGWQIVTAAWTASVDNDAANRDARAGKLKPHAIAGGPGDASLADAFKKLTTDGVDSRAARRADLVAIGSGPGERTVGGAAFARAWNAAWKGKVAIDATVGKLAPSGTTGSVAAAVELQKPGYKIPFFVFAIFDKAADGTWSLVHIHFAV